MNTDAEELLDDLGALRRRARQDQRGYWLPLLLFGLLILIAPLLYRAAPIPPGGGSFEGSPVTFAGLVLAPTPLVFPLLSDPGVVWAYWMAVLVVGVLITFGWYRLRAARAGVQPPIGTYLLIALGSAVVLELSPVFAWRLLMPLHGTGLTSTLVSVAALLVGLVLAVWSARRVVTTAVGRVTRLVGLVVGIVLAAMSGAMVLTLFAFRGYEALFVIAVGVFALAWMERSWGCGAVAVLFAAAALLTNLYNMENIYYDLFGYTPASIVVPFSDLVLSALVLVIGGVVGLTAMGRNRVE